MNKERVLAYEKAIQLTEKDLKEVAGGSFHLTHKVSTRGSGDISNCDATVTYSCDW